LLCVKIYQFEKFTYETGIAMAILAIPVAPALVERLPLFYGTTHNRMFCDIIFQIRTQLVVMCRNQFIYHIVGMFGSDNVWQNQNGSMKVLIKKV